MSLDTIVLAFIGLNWCFDINTLVLSLVIVIQIFDDTERLVGDLIPAVLFHWVGVCGARQPLVN